MQQESTDDQKPVRDRGLSREITAALLVKLALFWVLWHYAIQPSKPVIKPSITDVFGNKPISQPVGVRP